MGRKKIIVGGVIALSVIFLGSIFFYNISGNVDISKCENSTDEEQLYSCLMQIGIEKQDLSVCDNLTSEDYRGRCYRDVARAGIDKKICEELVKEYPDEITEMHDICYLEVGQRIGDLSLCEKIYNRDRKEDCTSYVSGRPRISYSDPTYNLILEDSFNSIGNWGVYGERAYLESQEVHITSNSEVKLWKAIEVPENVNIMKFDYRFVEPHGDIMENNFDMLYFFIDGEALWMVPSTKFNSKEMGDSDWIDITGLTGKKVNITFVLTNGTNEMAHVAIDNLRFYEEINSY